MELHFAPLQGYTDAIYRNAFHQIFGGIDVFYTPFIRLGNDGCLRRKDLKDIDSQRNNTLTLVPQLLPGSAQETKLLLSAIEQNGHRRADINLGCPFPMVVKSGRGSGLLIQTDTVHSILEEAAKHESIKLSVKVRLGITSPKDLASLLPVLESFPLEHLAIHARTTEQQYKGTPIMDAFSEIYTKAKLPLIYNGNIFSAEDAARLKSDFPQLKGLMLGRGLLMNPFLAMEIKNEDLSPDIKRDKLSSFHNALFHDYSQMLSGDSHLLSKMKTLWDYFYPNMEKKHKKKISKAKSIEAYLLAVRDGLLSFD